MHKWELHASNFSYEQSRKGTQDRSGKKVLARVIPTETEVQKGKELAQGHASSAPQGRESGPWIPEGCLQQ